MGNKAICVKQYLHVKCAADLFFFQHTEGHSVESSGSCSCQKVKRKLHILYITACVWIVYKASLKETHEGWVELLQYYTSANIDAVVSD
ncbi:uncharacterized protein Gasu_64810 [Galdieria sulphuraria]|uniref:Uncharacterized protein n=1 Tax=Galdieria sulphuraria TaxID=130081 RepID=M2XR25_GALSU|nr:uncharacterized protein Gasu_64810 [Galdieria sulphuraria]EME25859.1 hypothetical protein Gasu_64810 [Galdieria sulphuraria]|eukprot:XP_005702379.1 hypothetical protein Gasu_64810 [Galdieria sulphuraria]